MDKILLGSDYPYEEMDESIAFLESLGLDDASKEHLYNKGAKALGFGL